MNGAKSINRMYIYRLSNRWPKQKCHDNGQKCHDNGQKEKLPSLLSFIRDKNLDELISWHVVVSYIYICISNFWRSKEDSGDTISKSDFSSIHFMSMLLGVLNDRICELSNGTLGVMYSRPSWDLYGSLTLPCGLAVTDDTGTDIIRGFDVRRDDVFAKLTEFRNEVPAAFCFDRLMSISLYIVNNHGQEICDMVNKELNLKA